MNGEIELIGSFADEELCVHAIQALTRARLAPTRVFTPIPSEHIAEALGHGKSAVRGFVLAGGIAGVLGGFALTIGTSWEWNLVVGGKPIVSMPPFIIIAFELMVLFGGTLAVLGFFLTARMPALDPIPGYSERFAGDRFGVMVKCDEAEGERIESILRAAGAEEIVRPNAVDEDQGRGS